MLTEPETSSVNKVVRSISGGITHVAKKLVTAGGLLSAGLGAGIAFATAQAAAWLLFVALGASLIGAILIVAGNNMQE